MSAEQTTQTETEATGETATIDYGYYPGCSLHGTSHEYDDSVQEVARLLGIRLLEIPDWNCCGASSAHMTNHRLAVGLAVRNLEIAEKEGRDLVVPCAACFQRLKHAQKEMREAPRAAPAAAAITVLHLSELLAQREMLIKIRDGLKNPLAGRRLAPYYGCLITRPPSVTGFSDFEDPKGIDLLVRILGGQAVRWSYKTECCGGSLTMPRADITQALVSKIIKAAVKAGAQGIVTMCPMCQANLETRQLDLKKQDGSHPVLPVFFATELIADGMAETRQADRWKKHLIDPAQAFAQPTL